MLQGLNFVMLHVPDVAAVRDFYAETLGLPLVDQNPGFLQFAPSGGGAALGIGVEPNADRIELWWFVGNADAAHIALRNKGVEIVSPPADMPFGRTLAIKDPAGSTLYLLQPRQG